MEITNITIFLVNPRASFYEKIVDFFDMGGGEGQDLFE